MVCATSYEQRTTPTSHTYTDEQENGGLETQCVSSSRYLFFRYIIYYYTNEYFKDFFYFFYSSFNGYRNMYMTQPCGRDEERTTGLETRLRLESQVYL
jgi:hypothetical protein